MSKIQSMGYTKTYIINNNDIQEKGIEWQGDEDDNKLNIHLAVNDNGEKELMNIQLDKNDVMDLLKTQSIGMPLTSRHQNDFLPIKKRSMRRMRKPKPRRKQKIRTRRRNKR